VLECGVFSGTVSNALSEGGTLLALAFVILLHLLLAPPVLPGTQAYAESQGKQDQDPTPYNDLTQPQPAVAEQCQSGSRPEGKLSGRQESTIDCGAHKVREVGVQCRDLLLQVVVDLTRALFATFWVTGNQDALLSLLA
jgi:hypothetical protein